MPEAPVPPPPPPPLLGRVVVGFDGSDPAVRALDSAAREAARRETGVEVLCGWPWTTPPAPGLGLGIPAGEQHARHEQMRAVLESAAGRVRERAPDVRVVPTMTSEPAATALVQASRTAGLTVVGTRGHGGFIGLLLGSVALRVAAHSESPLMVVRGDADADQGARGTVLVGLESEADDEALRFGFEEAKRRDARLRVLHVWQYPPLPGGLQMPPADVVRREAENRRGQAEAVARYAAARLSEKYPEVRASADHECRAAAPALTDASREADLVVLAAHRGHRHLGLQLGPVTHALLHHAHCPVTLVPVG